MSRDKLSDFGLLLLRIFLFAILIFYGSQKVFGAFGGMGFAGTLSAFHQEHGFPTWLTTLAVVSEFAGSIGVLIGLLTRLASLGIVCTMATASYEMFSGKGSYMAMHLPLALCGMALALLFTGAGQFSADYAIKHRRKGTGFARAKGKGG